MPPSLSYNFLPTAPPGDVWDTHRQEPKYMATRPEAAANTFPSRPSPSCFLCLDYASRPQEMLTLISSTKVTFASSRVTCFLCSVIARVHSLQSGLHVIRVPVRHQSLNSTCE
ncbi:hypothetical protein J6590_065993 [Homalodisca vitripennis]|nr:hypothetical protein J6590_065993 [Homalodisca vitripennis]